MNRSALVHAVVLAASLPAFIRPLSNAASAVTETSAPTADDARQLDARYSRYGETRFGQDPIRTGAQGDQWPGASPVGFCLWWRDFRECWRRRLQAIACARRANPAWCAQAW